MRPGTLPAMLPCRSGGNPAHHRMSRYALSIAQVIKAQACRTPPPPLLPPTCRQLASLGPRVVAPRLDFDTAPAPPAPPPAPQFSASKALPGGAAGAEALAQTLDLGKTLLLSRMDLASLRAADLQPEWTGAAGLKSQARGARSGRLRCLRCVSAVAVHAASRGLGAAERHPRLRCLSRPAAAWAPLAAAAAACAACREAGVRLRVVRHLRRVRRDWRRRSGCEFGDGGRGGAGHDGPPR